MTLNDYQLLAGRTINPRLRDHEMLDHALHGLTAEVGELHGLYQKMYQGHTLDLTHVQKELGDILWMLAEICTAYEWTLDTVAHVNINKLKARYPDGFDADHSLHRKEGDA